MMKNRIIFKILENSSWEAAKEGALIQAPVDIADGYVHFSTATQVQETLDKWFQGVENAVLIAFDTDDFSNTLKWEVSRGRELFPHVYGEVKAALAKKSWQMELGPSGAPLAPQEALEYDPST